MAEGIDRARMSPGQVAAFDKAMAWAREGGQPVFRLFGYAGTGKAQPLDAMIQTPIGPRRLGDLAVGDEVISVRGNPIRVLGVFPQGVKPAYRITFRDGTSTTSSEDHLWTVTTAKDHRAGKWRTITLREMIDAGIRRPSGDMRWRVPLCSPVSYAPGDALPLDPYLLGVLLGDGSLGGNTPVVTIGDKDPEMETLVRARLPVGVEMHGRKAPGCRQFTLVYPATHIGNPVKAALRDLGVAVHGAQKHIPTIYRRASIVDRLELLRGLMDADGSVRGNRTEFSTSTPQLAQDVAEVVRSLGGVAVIGSSTRPRSGKVEFGVNVKMFVCPFRMERKATRWRPSSKNPPSRCIASVEPAGDREQQCIQVEALDGLYLTDDFIVTHNTSIARALASEIGGTTAYMAFTGKAALVMRRSGCAGAATIHSSIYTVEELPDGRIEFVRNPDGAAAQADLIVVDECSMVDADLARDLLSFGKPVLVLGDPAQLPPVKGAGFFTEAPPDAMLTEIHRQAAENPIIRAATDVREGRRLRLGDEGRLRVVARGTLGPEDLLGADQVIVGLNRTRTAYNERLRTHLGRRGWRPVPGDRLVCLRNDRDKGLFNGGLHAVAELERERKGCLELVVTSEDFPDREPQGVKVRREFFAGGAEELTRDDKRGTQEFDYGYALTCHKAQGSQWPGVVLYDESGVFREDARRWAYTGITRAAERLTVVTGC